MARILSRGSAPESGGKNFESHCTHSHFEVLAMWDEAIRMKTLEILQEARNLLSTPDKWTQNYIARDDKNHGLESAISPDATCWCMSGAVLKAAETDSLSLEWIDLLEKAIKELHPEFHLVGGIPGFNDTHTHEEVLRVFDRAIESCKSPNL